MAEALVVTAYADEHVLVIKYSIGFAVDLTICSKNVWVKMIGMARP